MTTPGGLRRLVLWSAGYQGASQVVSIATGLAVTALLSRHLGPAAFGGFTYLFAFLYFFLALNDLGINTILVRELVQHPEHAAESLGRMVVFRLLLGSATLVVAWIVILVMRFPFDLAVALGIFALVLPLTALKLPTVVFQSALRFDYGAAVDMATGVATLLAVLLVIWANGGLIAVAGALVAVELVGSLLTRHLAGRIVRPVWRVDRRYWGAILQSSLPLGLAGLLSALLNRLDFFMLERMTDLGQVGFYGAAYKVTTLVERLPQLVMTTLYPVMSRAAREDPAHLRRLYRRSVAWLGGCAVPAAVLVTLGADPLVRLVFGGAYQGAVAPLRLLIWASAGLYAALPGGVLLISLRRERVNLAAQAVALGVNLVLNLAWIPRWGSAGAALATVVSFAVILVVTAVASELALRERAAAAPALDHPAGADGIVAGLVDRQSMP